MSKNYMGGTYVVPASPGLPLATIMGIDPLTLFSGVLVAPSTNVGDLTIKRSTANGANTALAGGQSTPPKVVALGSITLYSTNGTDVVIVDGTSMDTAMWGVG